MFFQHKNSFVNSINNLFGMREKNLSVCVPVLSGCESQKLLAVCLNNQKLVPVKSGLPAFYIERKLITSKEGFTIYCTIFLILRNTLFSEVFNTIFIFKIL